VWNVNTASPRQTAGGSDSFGFAPEGAPAALAQLVAASTRKAMRFELLAHAYDNAQRKRYPRSEAECIKHSSAP